MSHIEPGDCVRWTDYKGDHRQGHVLWESPTGAYAVKEGPMADPQVWPGSILTVVTK